MRFIILNIFILLVLVSCNDGSLDVPDNPSLVVRAYLYQGEPINDIQLRETTTIDADSLFLPPVNDAQVVLEKEGQSFYLQPSAGDSGYYHYEATDLQVQSGDLFNLTISFNGQTVEAQTRVPSAPESLSLSKSTLEIIDPAQMGGGSFGQIDSNAIELRWHNSGDQLFYVVIDNVEENPTAIETGFGRFPPRFISQPLNRSDFRVNQRALTHYGRHRVKLYRINQEYADLYFSRQQDSRDLNEPLSNVQNGLGVFSAFACDSVFFTAQ